VCWATTLDHSQAPSTFGRTLEPSRLLARAISFTSPDYDVRVYVCRAMEGPRAGISNVDQHVNQLEQRLEDCLAHKANSADVPSNTQVSHACLCNL